MHRHIAIGGQDLTEFIPHRVGGQPFASTDLDQRHSPTGRDATRTGVTPGRSAATRRASPIAGPRPEPASRCQTQERCLPEGNHRPRRDGRDPGLFRSGAHPYGGHDTDRPVRHAANSQRQMPVTAT